MACPLCVLQHNSTLDRVIPMQSFLEPFAFLQPLNSLELYTHRHTEILLAAQNYGLELAKDKAQRTEVIVFLHKTAIRS